MTAESTNYVEVPEGAVVVVETPRQYREFTSRVRKFSGTGLVLTFGNGSLAITRLVDNEDDQLLALFSPASAWVMETEYPTAPVVVPEVEDAEGSADEVVILHGGKTRSELIRDGMAPAVATYILRRNAAAEVLKEIPHVTEKFRKILGDDTTLMNVANLVSDHDSRAFLTELLSDTNAAGRDA